MRALQATGNSNQAYKLLLSEDYPSWGFEVINGANTIWERWNSYIKGEGFTNNAGMNSFNHYAFGSVNEWMFGNMAGIKTIEPGYRSFAIRPEIAQEGINTVKASYQSINGEIKSSWSNENGKLVLNISIPANTKAQVAIPATTKDDVLESDKSLKECSEIEIGEFKNGILELIVGSGDYKFSSSL